MQTPSLSMHLLATLVAAAILIGVSWANRMVFPEDPMDVSLPTAAATLLMRGLIARFEAVAPAPPTGPDNDRPPSQ